MASTSNLTPGKGLDNKDLEGTSVKGSAFFYVNPYVIQQANKMDFTAISLISKEVLSGLDGLSVTASKFVLQTAISMIEDLSVVACSATNETSNPHNLD